MLANANQQSEIAPVGQHIRTVTAVCQKHGIDHGGHTTSLAAFMEALGSNKLLAMNFWSLVAHLTTVARPQSPHPDWLLAIIVEGVTAHTLAETRAAGSEQSRLVQRLASMLAGEDLDSPLAHTPLPPSRQVDVSGIRRLAIRLTEADRAATPIAQRSTTPIAFPLPQLSTAGSHPPAPIAPRLGLGPLSGYLNAATPMLATNPVYGAALLMVLVIVGSAWLAHASKSVAWLNVSASVRAPYHPAPASSNQKSSPTPAATISAPFTVPAIPHAIPPANPAPKAVQAKSARTLFPPPPAPEIGSVPDGDASDNTGALLTRDADGLIQLPESIMQRNLESSRVPIYPEAAKAAHLEGVVVVHAVVAQDGSVGHLRVVTGDPALRHAALDSVATWHYRPILVQGKPVEVSTTISVDFSETE
jgi:TonB family protein